MAKNWTDRLPDLLQDYQEAPPEGLWDAVRSGMVSRKRRIPAAVWYVAGGLAAAAAIALLLFLRPSAPAPSVTVVPGDLAQVSPSPKQEMADQVGHDGTPSPVIPGPTSVIPGPAPVIPGSTSLIPGSDRESPPESDGDVPENGTPPAKIGQNDGDVPEIGTSPSPLIPGSDRESPPRLRLRVTLASSGVQQYASATTQGYGLPSGIITKSSGPQDAPDYRMLGRNKPSTADTRYSRLPRWALGVNIGLPFRFSLETGLVLSPLRTTTAAEVGSYHYETRTDQYYLGIPLHLQYSIWEGRRLGVYASGGPMYQFAVATRTRTTTTPLSGGNTQTIAEDKTLCKDALWSADLALGLQLRLFQRSALFVQPGVTWYFPGSEAPQSLYTEQRTAFELTFGYRVQLF